MAQAKAVPVARTVFEEVRAYCVANADAERARRYTRYFTEGFDPWGVDHTAPEWSANLERWTAMVREAGGTAWLDSGDLLVRTGRYEEASIAILMAKNLRERYTLAAFARIGGWFDGGIRNWGHTDVLSGEVLGVFLAEGIVAPEDLAAWCASPHKYQRRAAPVSLIRLVKDADPLRLPALIEPLMRDPERVVHQGTGWFLRELWKRHPQPVEAFLLRHKDTCARLIVQYATEKMDQAAKARFKAAKKQLR